MAKKKDGIAKLAKKNTKSTTKKTKNSDDLAKKKVEELLSDVELNSKNKKDDLIELDENPKDIKWLQNQVSVLTEHNEKLELEAKEAKENYKKLFQQYEAIKSGENIESVNMIPDSIIKNGIIEEFVAAQDNFLGLNPERRRYTDMKILHFLRRMLKRYDFLSEYKKI